MKKCYKAPEIVVVDLDLEGICQTSDPEKPGFGSETDPSGDAASYRSSLWND